MTLAMIEPHPMPSNLQAEQALLGELLLRNDSLLQVPPYFCAAHFFASVHGEIFDAIRKFYAEGKQATAITLKAYFDHNELLKEQGGARYLVQLMASAGYVHNISGFCELIHQAWMHRELASLCRDSLSAIGNEENPNDIAGTIAQRTQDILGDAIAGKLRTDYDIGQQILEDIKNIPSPTSTGLMKLDSAMGGGLMKNKLYGFAARKKVGKTILAATLSYNLSQRGIKHLFICAEMSAKEVHQRILARATNSYESAFRSEYGQSQIFQNKLVQAIVESKKSTFFEDKPGIRFEELQQIIPLYAVRYKIQGFILDYWQLVGGKPKNKSTSEHLDEIAQWLATVCRKYGIWGVVMAQINQDGNTRGSEGLRLAADQVYEIHRKDISAPCAWMEMMETRYTPWTNIGSDMEPGLFMNEKGPFFEENA
jgi:replicative DNA helicase